MTVPALRYPIDVLAGDYVRAGVGVLLTGLPLVLLDVSLWIGVLFGAAVLLFVVFLWSTVRRHLTEYRVDDEAIVADGPFGRVIRWSELTRFKLSYYATGRERRNGWMELKLGSRSGSLSVDSKLDQFDRVAAKAAKAAVGNNLALSPATMENLAAMGIALEPEEGAAGVAGRFGVGAG